MKEKMTAHTDGNLADEFKACLLKAEETTFELSESLEWLREDLMAESDGWKFFFVIDYHELHRYLHPATDEYRNEPEKFFLGQMVLSYLFEASSKKLLLLPMYLEEFKARLATIRLDLEQWWNKAEYKTKRQQELGSFLDNLPKESYPRNAIDIVRRYSLETLLETYIRNGLNRGMSRYGELVKNGTIYFIDQIKDFNPSFEIDEKFHDYQIILAEVWKCRPFVELHQPNITDAKAAYWVKKANDTNSYAKKAFVLLSSSRAVKKAFQSVKLFLTDKGVPFESCILRDICYILFQYYFCRSEYTTEQIMKNIEETQNLFKEYIKRMEALHQKAVNITLADINQANVLPLYRKVMDSIWEFETYMAKGIQFKSVEPLNENEVIDQIRNVAQKGDTLRNSVARAIAALKVSLQNIDSLSEEISEKAADATLQKELTTHE